MNHLGNTNLFEQCPAPCFFREMNETNIRVNQAFREIFFKNTPPKAVLNISDFIYPGDVNKLSTTISPSGSSGLKPSIRCIIDKKIRIFEFTEIVLEETEEVFTYLKEIENQNDFEATINRKNRYLQGISGISELLIEQVDYKTQFNRCLQEMGNLVDTNRVYIFENFLDENSGKLATKQIFEWVSNPALAQIGNPELQNFPFEEYCPVTCQLFRENKPYRATRSEFHPELDEILSSQGILSILFIPLFVNQVFWGFMGFDHCYQEKRWDDDDLALLRGVATNLSLFISREESDRKKKYYELRLDYAIQASGMGVWDWNLLDNSIYHSPTLAGMLGYGFSDFGQTFDSWAKRVHQDDLESVKEKLDQYFTGKTSEYSAEYRLLCADGSYKWVLDRGSIISQSDNSVPERMIGTHTDISGIKNLQFNLTNTLDSFKSMFETNPLPMLIYDNKTLQILKANDAANKKYELQIEKHELLSVSEIVVPAAANNFLPAFSNANVLFSEEIPWQHKSLSGNQFYVNCAAHHILFEGSEATFIVVTDVTKRIKSENSLKKSEERMKAIIKAVPDMVFIVSYDGVYQEYFVNENDLKLITTKEQFIGKSVYEILPGSLAELFTSEFAKVRGGKKLGIINYDLTLPSGTSYFEAKITNIAGENQLLCIIRDRTAQVNFEKILKESEEKLRVVAQNIPHGTVNLFDGNLTLLYSEGNGKNMMPKECVNCTNKEKCEPCYFTTINSKFEKALGGEEINFESIIDDRNFLTYINPIMGEIGEVKYIIQMSIEITDFKKQENEFNKTRERLESLVNAMQDAIYIYDLEVPKLVFINPMVKTISGFEVKDFLNDPKLWFRIIHPDDLSGYFKNIKKLSNWAGIYTSIES